MKKLTIFACALLLLGAVNANAATITLDTSSSEYIGLINPDHPADPSEEASFINILIGQPAPSGPTLIGANEYTRSGNTFGSLPTAIFNDVPGAKMDSPSTGTVDVTGYTYLLGKYDAGKAGAYVWYVGGLTGEQTIPTNLGGCGSNGCGLSHWTLFTPTTTAPDGGATLMLLGGALVCLSALRRKFNA